VSDEDLLNSYLAVIRRDRRMGTYYSVKSSLNKFLRYLERNGLGLDEVRAKDAAEYQRELVEAGYSSSMVSNCIARSKAFYEYLKTEQATGVNPFYDLERVRNTEKLPRHIPKERELFALLARLALFFQAAGTVRILKRYRAHVAAELLYSTGMRIGEAARLTLADIDLNKGTIEVRGTKSGYNRLCFLNEYAREVLRLYLERVRPALEDKFASGNSSLLFGMKESALTECVNQGLAAVCREMGFPKLTCHTFRHAFGAHLLRSGCDIRFIQTFLGHEWLSTTQIYTKVEKEDLKRVLDACHPRNFPPPAGGERREA
jgi:integrase/recombinase XerC